MGIGYLLFSLGEWVMQLPRRVTYVGFEIKGGDRKLSQVANRNLEGLAIPEGATGFIFFDFLEGSYRFEDQEVEWRSSKPLAGSESKLHILNAEILSKDDLIARLSKMSPQLADQVRGIPGEQFVYVNEAGTEEPLTFGDGALSVHMHAAKILRYDPATMVVVELRARTKR